MTSLQESLCTVVSLQTYNPYISCTFILIGILQYQIHTYIVEFHENDCFACFFAPKNPNVVSLKIILLLSYQPYSDDGLVPTTVIGVFPSPLVLPSSELVSENVVNKFLKR